MKLPEFFGLDVSSNSIKVAKIDYSSIQGPSPLLQNIGVGLLPKPINSVISEDDKKEFCKKLNEVRQNASITTNKVVVSLPEASIFSKVIDVPDLPEEQLEKVIFFESKNHLPVSPEDVRLDYIPIAKKTLSNNRKIVQILLIAAPKNMVDKYIDILTFCGLEILALETESIASARVLTLTHGLDKGALVIDFGANGMSISLVKGANVVFSQSIRTGSNALTEAIARSYNISLQQAEQYKRTYGILPGQLEGKIEKAIDPTMRIIVSELSRIINFIKLNLPEFAPEEIIFTGEGSLLPGLIPYIQTNVQLPTKLFNPISNFQLSDAAKYSLNKFSPMGFVVSLGLALKIE